MDLVDANVQQALQFVATINRGGLAPESNAVDRFVASPRPRGAQRDSIFSVGTELGRWVNQIMGPVVEPAEEVSCYLVRMGWAVASSMDACLTLTELGQALLQGLAATSSENAAGAVEVIALSPSDSISVGKLARVLGEARAGMYIDPYFEPEDLDWLAKMTSIRRLLIGRPTVISEMAVALANIDVDIRPEVRIDRSKLLHDRAIVSESGQITVIGTSMNRLHKTVTALIKLPLSASAGYSPHLEDLWNSADPVPAIVPPSMAGR